MLIYEILDVKSGFDLHLPLAKSQKSEMWKNFIFFILKREIKGLFSSFTYFVTGELNYGTSNELFLLHFLISYEILISSSTL